MLDFLSTPQFVALSGLSPSTVRRRVHAPPTGVVIPHDIYDVFENRGHINLGLSHDTTAFACDSFRWYWNEFGRRAYPQATSILWLCDCGCCNAANKSEDFKAKPPCHSSLMHSSANGTTTQSHNTKHDSCFCRDPELGGFAAAVATSPIDEMLNAICSTSP